jgi:TonB-dependent receptor
MNSYRYAWAPAQIPAALNEVRRFMLFVTALAVSFLSAEVQAQDSGAATGTIRGRVQNATNGAYMENVTINVAGTTRQVRTNSFGEYVIRDVPAGEVTLTANYVGESEQTAMVTVRPGAEVSSDFTFRQTEQMRRTEDGAVVLDPFTVNVERYRNAQAIAIAEERRSINIKNVVSTDVFGNIPNGNIGEFVKFLPGIQVDYGTPAGGQGGYSQNDANGVSVRGFGPEDTAILIDGLPVSSTLPGNLTNQVGLDQLQLNNASRVELIKVATPDMPNNSIGGQVNLITRSAFEYARPTYNTSLFVNVSSLQPELKKTPGPLNKETYKTTPGTTFTVTYPFSSTFGIAISGSWIRQFNQDYRAAPRWNNSYNAAISNGSVTNAAGERSSEANPFMDRYQITDTASIADKSSANIKMDWKITPNQLLRANVQYSTNKSPEAQRRISFQPTVSNGVVWDETQTVGSTANSSTGMTITTRDREGESLTGQLQYNATLAGFVISAAGSISQSEAEYQDEENGHYSGLDINLNPGRVALYYGPDGVPSRVETFTRGTNQLLDHTILHNWASSSTIAQSGQSLNERIIGLYKFDIERPLDFIPLLGSNSLSVKAGLRRDEDDNKKTGRGSGYRKILRPGATFSVADLLDADYLGQSPGFGLPAQQWASTYKLYELDQENDLFEEPTSGADAVTNYNSFVGQQKDITITRDAWYAMLTGSFLSNRLGFVGGIRQEQEKRVGRSPFTDNKWNYLKTPDGSLYTDAAHPNGVRTNNTGDGLFATTPAGDALRSALAAAGIAFPSTPYGSTASDLAARKLQYQPLREVNQKQKGDPSYSFSTSFKLTKKIDLKAAYSRSFSLQDLELGNAGGIISGTSAFSIEEFTTQQQLDNDGILGAVKVANPGLKPETSENWDFEIAYYTDSGGKLSASYYTKTVTNQVQTFQTFSGTPTFDLIMDSIGLGSEGYDDWRVETSYNTISPQKTDGMEFQVQQDFAFLGGWGRRFSGFVSWAMTDFPLPAPVEPLVLTNPDGSTSTFNPEVERVKLRADRFGGAGLMYSGPRFTAQLRGTYRNENQTPGTGIIVLDNGNEIRRVQPAETRVDVNFGYMLTKRYSLFASARDVLNGERDEEWHDNNGAIPGYASLNDRRKFGTVWTIGINGTF